MNEATILALRRKHSLWNMKKNQSNEKIEHNEKNETSRKIGYHKVNEVTILALRRKQRL